MPKNAVDQLFGGEWPTDQLCSREAARHEASCLPGLEAPVTGPTINCSTPQHQRANNQLFGDWAMSNRLFRCTADNGVRTVLAEGRGSPR